MENEVKKEQELNELRINSKTIMEDFERGDAYRLLKDEYDARIGGLKYAYEVKGDEAAKLAGRYEGLSFFFNIISAFKKEGQKAQDDKDLATMRVDTSTEEPKQL